MPERDDFGRCGNYATAWLRDVVSLAPGESIALDDILDPSVALEFAHSGPIRVYAHYQYGGGAKRSFDGFGPVEASTTQPALPPELAAGGPFEVVSAPLELRVHVDDRIQLELSLRRAQIRVGERVSFDALAEAFVTNRAAEARAMPRDELESGLLLEPDAYDGFWTALVRDLRTPERLGPLERVALRAPDGQDTFVRAAPGHVRLRLRYWGVDDGGRLRRAHSPWVDLDVVP